MSQDSSSPNDVIGNVAFGLHRPEDAMRNHVAPAAPALPTAEADELRAAALALPPDEQHALATALVANIGYELTLEPMHPDTPGPGSFERAAEAAFAASGGLTAVVDPAALATTPETAKPDTSAADGLRLKDLLNGRDAFIVNEGLWSKFVATLPQKAAPATASSGGMVDDILKELREEEAALSKTAWGRLDGGQDCSIAAGLIDRAASAIEALSKQVADLTKERDKAVERLRPFADAVFNDNGDMTITRMHDSQDHINAYFVVKRYDAARAARGDDANG